MKSRTIAALLLSAALILPLGGCATTDQGDNSQSINSALASAAAEASATGDKQESLVLLERMYKREPTNADTALKYATALQEAGRSNRALLVMGPFIQSGKASPSMLVEYASVNAAVGNYDIAAETARKAAVAAPQNGQAWHVLGISLDAKGSHPEAEDAFRKALQNWSGDPSPVMNNLGLNLASQGFIDEAVTTLKKAVELAPGRPEIERNLRIVTALQNQPGTHENKRVPPPARKPGSKPADKMSEMKPAPIKTAPISKTAVVEKPATAAAVAAPAPVAKTVVRTETKAAAKPETKTAGSESRDDGTVVVNKDGTVEVKFDSGSESRTSGNSKPSAEEPAAGGKTAAKKPAAKPAEAAAPEKASTDAPASLRPEDKRT